MEDWMIPYHVSYEAEDFRNKVHDSQLVIFSLIAYFGLLASNPVFLFGFIFCAILTPFMFKREEF